MNHLALIITCVLACTLISPADVFAASADEGPLCLADLDQKKIRKCDERYLRRSLCLIESYRMVVESRRDRHAKDPLRHDEAWLAKWLKIHAAQLRGRMALERLRRQRCLIETYTAAEAKRLQETLDSERYLQAREELVARKRRAKIAISRQWEAIRKTFRSGRAFRCSKSRPRHPPSEHGLPDDIDFTRTDPEDFLIREAQDAGVDDVTSEVPEDLPEVWPDSVLDVLQQVLGAARQVDELQTKLKEDAAWAEGRRGFEELSEKDRRRLELLLREQALMEAVRAYEWKRQNTMEVMQQLAVIEGVGSAFSAGPPATRAGKAADLLSKLAGAETPGIIDVAQHHFMPRKDPQYKNLLQTKASIERQWQEVGGRGNDVPPGVPSLSIEGVVPLDVYEDWNRNYSKWTPPEEPTIEAYIGFYKLLKEASEVEREAEAME